MKKTLLVLSLIVAFLGCEDQVIKGSNTVERTPNLCTEPSPETEPSPLKFSGINSITDITPTSVTINWDDISGMHLYNIIVYTLNSREIISTVNAPSSSTVITSLTPDTEYRFLVRGLDKQGLIDSNSNVVTVRTGPWPTYNNNVSVKFNGNQSVNLGPSSNFGSGKDAVKKLSFSMWVKPDLSNVSSEVRLITFHSGANPATALSIGLTQTKIIISYRDKSGLFRTFEKEVNLDDSRWHHIAFSSKNNSMKLYVDGSSVAFIRENIIAFGTHGVHLGAYTGIQKGFVGLMDEVSIFNSQLSSKNIKSIYNSRASQDPRDLVPGRKVMSWYRMGDHSFDDPTNIEDVVGANNGSPLNMTGKNFIFNTP